MSFSAKPTETAAGSGPRSRHPAVFGSVVSWGPVCLGISCLDEADGGLRNGEVFKDNMIGP